MSASLALGALCLGWSHHTYSQSAVVEISNTPAVNSQELPIQNGERLSDWMLKERQNQNTKSQINYASPPYYLGTSWLTPKEVNAQEVEKLELFNALQKIDFPDDAAGQKTKQAFTKLITSLRPTGRVVLPNTNPRYLEASPKLNPVLENTDRVIVPRC